MRFSDLQDARVAILGMGREGRAVWRQIRKRFPEKPIFMFAESVLDESFASNLWFAENPGAKTICISGTMGKSTCAALLSHLLDRAGIKNCLAGNIGRPMLDCEGHDVDWWVIELSSYQLSDLEANPDIALLLNLSTEHVDWHGNVEQYHADKLRLIGLANEGRIVANFTDPVLSGYLRGNPAVTWFNHEDTWQVVDGGVSGTAGRHVTAPLSLPGKHNLQNLAAVLTILDLLGPLNLDVQVSLAS